MTRQERLERIRRPKVGKGTRYERRAIEYELRYADKTNDPTRWAEAWWQLHDYYQRLHRRKWLFLVLVLANTYMVFWKV